jgi:Rrf2 family protein
MQLLASEEYGLRCLLQVAGAPDGSPVSISQISAAEGISPEYTAKLMREQRVGELVHSVRGAEGGDRLARPARPAHRISAWAALQVLGGSLYSEASCPCLLSQRDGCVRHAGCSIRALGRTLESLLKDTLEPISLANLARDESAMGSWLNPTSLAVLARDSQEARDS